LPGTTRPTARRAATRPVPLRSAGSPILGSVASTARTASP
jgi:hypothetical protein